MTNTKLVNQKENHTYQSIPISRKKKIPPPPLVHTYTYKKKRESLYKHNGHELFTRVKHWDWKGKECKDTKMYRQQRTKQKQILIQNLCIKYA